MHTHPSHTNTHTIPEEDSQGRTFRTWLRGLPEQNCQDRTDRTELLGQGCLDRTLRTGLQGQNCQDRTARAKLPGQDCKGKTARTGLQKKTTRAGQHVECSQDRKKRTGHPERERQNWICRTQQKEQACQDRAARERLPWHGKIQGQDRKERTARKEQAEQESKKRTSRTGKTKRTSRTGLPVQNRPARSGQTEQDNQEGTTRTWQAEHDWQISTARIGQVRAVQLGQDSRDWKAGTGQQGETAKTDSPDRTDRKRWPEQNSKNS